MIVVAKEGDTLESIVKKIFGDLSMLDALYKANPSLIAWPPEIPKGTRIALPSQNTKGPQKPKGVQLWD